MGRPRQYPDDAARKRAQRARAASEDIDPTLPVHQVDEPDQPAGPSVPAVGLASEPTRGIEELLLLDPYAPLSEPEEQLVRDHFDFNPSEKRTRAEREAAADKMRAFMAPPDVQLPEDIAKVWWAPQDQATAKKLIAAWGLEAFRTSAIHQMALGEIRREQKLRAYRANLREGQKIPSPR